MDIKVHCIKEKNGSESIIIVIKNFFKAKKKNNILKKLDDIDDWHVGLAFGRTIPRLQRWYHVDGKPFSPFWKKKYKRWNSNKYEKWLFEFQQNIETELHKILEPFCEKHPSLKNVNFNSVLINKYVDGTHFIRQHKDNEMIFNNNPSIVSISFGATRQFIMQRVIYNEDNPKSMKRNKNEKHLDQNISLDHGTILIMGGACQKYFSHGILPEKCDEKRYNMTFRYTNPIELII